ncbi:L-Ala-D/L-Glu epimerase [bacterium BMS3Abin05]|nr:L-Ala-D/L-Glu epimerase [bacterium BMS3Abin05]GBE28210.1 L-Ala-D/L-Glu epimerase [bacterium BMS3Bbin03]
MTRKDFFRMMGLLGISSAAVPVSGFAKTGSKNFSSKGKARLVWEKKHLNLEHPWTLSRNTSLFKENVFVHYEKNGITGIGEAAPNVRYDESWESTFKVIEKAKPLMETANPWEYVDLGYSIMAIGHKQNAAKAALDIALMDWIGKSLNIPLYKFWGLDPSKTPLTDFSIGIASPEMIEKKVREAAPYPILKIKVGKPNDEEIIKAVRSVTDKPLRVDANEGWKTKEVALKKILWLEKQGVKVIEQPMPAGMIEEMKWLRKRVHVPLMADESVQTASDIPGLVGAFDAVNIKLMKAGGMQEALRMIWLAKSVGLKVMLGCMIESSVGITAAAQLSPLVDYADLDGNLLISNDPYVGVKVVNGKLILPDGPGLGVKPRKI